MKNHLNSIIRENMKYFIGILFFITVYTGIFSFYNIDILGKYFGDNYGREELLKNEEVMVDGEGWYVNIGIELQDTDLYVKTSHWLGVEKVVLNLEDNKNDDKESLTGDDLKKHIDDNYLTVVIKSWWKTGYMIKYIIFTVILLVTLQLLISLTKRVFPIVSAKILHRDKEELPVGAVDAMKYLYGYKVENKKLKVLTLLYTCILTIYGVEINNVIYLLNYAIVAMIVMIIIQLVIYMELSRRMKEEM